jgi:hypothetical protein
MEALSKQADQNKDDEPGTPTMLAKLRDQNESDTEFNHMGEGEEEDDNSFVKPSTGPTDEE